MNLTLPELKERLLQTCDEIDILELLNIDAEQLLDRFIDKLEDKYNELCEEFDIE